MRKIVLLIGLFTLKAGGALVESGRIYVDWARS